MVLGVALPAGSASAAGADATRERIERDLAGSGAASAAVAVDLDSGAVIASEREQVALVPASVNKLYTTAALLRHFGADGRLATRVLADQPLGLDGVLRGNLYLRGAGDPTFGAPQVRMLAEALVDGGLTAIEGQVAGDESAFDARRGPPSEAFRPSPWVAPLSALSYNRGRVPGSGRYQAQPALFAAESLRALLRARGVRVKRPAQVAVAPATAVELTNLPSPTMGALAAVTNGPSDNFAAETLLKALGGTAAGVGSTAAGAGAAEASMTELGASPVIVDGSGLSRRNRTSAQDVVTVLEAVDASPEGRVFEASLAVAGRSGTLKSRMRGTSAAGRCRAKTGSLTGVSALAGYCTTTSGARVAFAFVMNGISVPSARQIQDKLTVTLATYSPALAGVARR